MLHGASQIGLHCDWSALSDEAPICTDEGFFVNDFSAAEVQICTISVTHIFDSNLHLL